MFKRFATLAIGLTVTLAAAAVAATGFPGGADAGGTGHAVTSASKANFSSAVESPTWNFSCNSATKAWRFSINEVQIIDSSGRPWQQKGRLSGPWGITIFASAAAGPVPFSKVLTLAQNTSNGLFTVTASSTAANAVKWCQTGAGVSVVGFSGTSEPLLLDGTLI